MFYICKRKMHACDWYLFNLKKTSLIFIHLRIRSKNDLYVSIIDIDPEGDFFRIDSPDVVGPFVYMIADPDFTFMGFREIIFQVNRKPSRPLTDKYPVGRQISMKFRISPRVRCVIQLTEANVALDKIPEFLKLLEAELLAILTPASRAALGLTY